MTHDQLLTWSHFTHQGAGIGTHVSGYKARVQADYFEIFLLQVIGKHSSLCSQR